MSDDGLCPECGEYIGEDDWDSCPNCGAVFSNDGDDSGGDPDFIE